MACINVTITPVSRSVLTVDAVAGAKLAVAPVTPVVSAVKPTAPSALTVKPTASSALTVTPVGKSTLTLGEICTVSRGTIVVLAASDGPLRTRDGGYFLLNPATNPPGV